MMSLARNWSDSDANLTDRRGDFSFKLRKKQRMPNAVYLTWAITFSLSDWLICIAVFFFGRETQFVTRENSSIFARENKIRTWKNRKKPSKMRVKIMFCTWNFRQITHVKAKFTGVKNIEYYTREKVNSAREKYGTIFFFFFLFFSLVFFFFIFLFFFVFLRLAQPLWPSFSESLVF